MTERPIDVLRCAVLSQGGLWNAERAMATVRHYVPGIRATTVLTGRHLLKDLATEGLLVRNGTKWEWTLSDEAEQQRPARQIAERIDTALAKWGYADLEDVRQLVNAVLNPGKVQPLPQDRTKA